MHLSPISPSRLFICSFLLHPHPYVFIIVYSMYIENNVFHISDAKVMTSDAAYKAPVGGDSARYKE